MYMCIDRYAYTYTDMRRCVNKSICVYGFRHKSKQLDPPARATPPTVAARGRQARSSSKARSERSGGSAAQRAHPPRREVSALGGSAADSFRKPTGFKRPLAGGGPEGREGASPGKKIYIRPLKDL